VTKNIKAVLFIIKPFKKRYLLLVLIAFIAALFESLGYYALMPAIDIMLGQASGENQLSEKFISIIKLIGFNENILIGITLFIIVIFSLRFFLVITRIYTTQKLNWDIRNYYTLKVTKSYTNSPLKFLINQKHGEILNNALIEGQRAALVLTSLVEMVTKIMLILILYISLLVTMLHFTLILTGVIAIIWLVIRGGIKRFSDKIGKKRIIISQQLTSVASENISAIRNSKIFNLQDYNLKRFNKQLNKFSEIMIKYNFGKGIPAPITETILVLFFVSFVFYVNYANQNTIYNFSSIAIYFVVSQRIVQYLSYVVRERMNFLNHIPSLHLLIDLLNKDFEKEELFKGEVIKRINNDIIFKNVYFNYNKNEDIFKDLNLIIKKGEVTAIMGESGIGKSTLSDLILRLQLPSSGSLSLGNKNINNYSLNNWRNIIGYVSQESFFYNTSVFNNLTMGQNSLKESEVIKACKTANAHDFIRKLPNSYETILGDRAITLSGGQKQRIAIARVILKNPDLIIFDEATTSLDKENESIIATLIKKISKGKTIIIITHNIHPFQFADNIYELKKGGCIETYDLTSN